MLGISFAVSGGKGKGRKGGKERRKGLGFFVSSYADPSSQYAATTTARDLHCISVRNMERSYQEEARWGGDY
jgi:hypothetical protein